MMRTLGINLGHVMQSLPLCSRCSWPERGWHPVSQHLSRLPAQQHPHEVLQRRWHSNRSGTSSAVAAPSDVHAAPLDTVEAVTFDDQQQRLAVTDQQHAWSTATATFIRSLDIKNLALIAHQRIDFRPGLNVITGESGAGKSMLIQALHAVLGAPAGEDMVRSGEASCIVEASLQLSPAAQAITTKLLSDLGLPKRALPLRGNDDTANLHIRREIRRDGNTMRSSCELNGAQTSLRVLRAVAAAVVDINGQNSSLKLRDPATQIAMLDRLASTSHAAAAFGNTLFQLRALQSRLAAIDALGDEDHRQRLQDMLDEVRALGPEDGEERQLRAALRRLEARRSAVEQCQLACTALGSQGGIEEGMTAVETYLRGVLQLEEAANARAQEEREETAGTSSSAYEDEYFDDESSGAVLMGDALDTLEQARQLIAEAEAKVADYANMCHYSAANKQQLSSRLSQIVKCLKEHGAGNTGELLNMATAAEHDLDTWFQLEGQRGAMEDQVAQLRAELASQGTALSLRRRGAAGRLRAAVEAALEQLCMTGSRFDVRIGWAPLSEAAGGIVVSDELAATVFEHGGASYKATESGLDMVEFLLAAGPAEPLRLLGAVASGGESARIMMALKAAPCEAAADLRDGDAAASTEETITATGQPIMVLDEIDSGVGTRLGAPIAHMLRRMAAPGGTAQQVLCVSHLPQVAAHAQHHLCVRKQQAADGRMQTFIVPLVSQAERLQEVADMLGQEDSEGSASLMLREAAS